MSAAQPTLPTIISIDDEPNVLKLIAKVLETTANVRTFADGREALTALSAAKPDLIICDINMPGLDGFELHEQVRALPGLRGVPFIFLTGLGDRETFRKGMHQGADDYLTKPFTPAELQTAVRARLERLQTLRGAEATGLSLKTLDGVGVTVDGQTVQYEAKKVIELLLFLMVHGGADVDRLQREMWPKPVSDNTIHVLINRARKSFAGAAQFIFADDRLSLQLDKTYTWDAELFEAAAQEALKTDEYKAISKAVSLYPGTFLPGFSAPWTEQQRRYYDSLCLELLERGLELAPNAAARKTLQTKLDSFLG